MTDPTTRKRHDTDTRLAELHAIRALLLPDQDDPKVLSEIVTVEADIARLTTTP